MANKRIYGAFLFVAVTTIAVIFFSQKESDQTRFEGDLKLRDQYLNHIEEQPRDTPVKEDFKVVGYFPDYRKKSFDRVSIDKLSHLIFTFLIPRHDASLVMSPEDLEFLREMRQKTLGSNVKLGIAVGGWYHGDDSAFEAIARSEELRKKFAQNLYNFAQDYDLDGVDIDWEWPLAGETASFYQYSREFISNNIVGLVEYWLGKRSTWYWKPIGQEARDFELMMAEIYKLFNPKGKFVSIAVVTGPEGSGINQGVFEWIDFANVMSYELLRYKSMPSHAPFILAEDSINYWLARGLPKEKMVIGVPFFSRTDNKDEARTYSSFVNVDTSYACKDRAFRNNRWHYYNGLKTMKAKTELSVREAGGVMIWELAQDAEGESSLHNLIWQQIYNPDTVVNCQSD